MATPSNAVDPVSQGVSKSSPETAGPEGPFGRAH
jgi:hypothetical protein